MHHQTLKNLREQHGLSQKALAAKLSTTANVKCHQAMIARWELFATPSQKWADILGKCFHVPPSTFRRGGSLNKVVRLRRTMTEDIDYNSEIPKLSLEARDRIHRIMYLDQARMAEHRPNDGDEAENNNRPNHSATTF